MPKVKIARKSTWVDMTAFVDVAFLILSFFMLATKFKPDEAVPIKTPSSVSAEKILGKHSAIILVDSKGKVYVQLSDEGTKKVVFDQIGQKFGINLPKADFEKAIKEINIGSPLSELQNDYSEATLTPATWKGIPTNTDSIGGELNSWIEAIQFADADSIQFYVRADGSTKYPAFKNVLNALKNRNQNKFFLITNVEDVPGGTELDKINTAKERARENAKH